MQECTPQTHACLMSSLAWLLQVMMGGRPSWGAESWEASRASGRPDEAADAKLPGSSSGCRRRPGCPASGRAISAADAAPATSPAC